MASFEDRILAWWMNVNVVDRPPRVIVQDVVGALGLSEYINKELNVYALRRMMTNAKIENNQERERELVKSLEFIQDSENIQDDVEESLKSIGFKKKLFDDGWFYVPPVRLLAATPRPKPVYPSLVDPKLVFVYFIQSVMGGPIKIGRSEDVLRRIAEMQTANPYRLHLLLAIPFDEAEEKEMHEMFADLRIEGGEWFHPGEALLAFIDERILRLCAVTTKAL